MSIEKLGEDQKHVPFEGKQKDEFHLNLLQKLQLSRYGYKANARYEEAEPVTAIKTGYGEFTVKRDIKDGKECFIYRMPWGGQIINDAKSPNFDGVSHEEVVARMVERIKQYVATGELNFTI